MRRIKKTFAAIWTRTRGFNFSITTVNTDHNENL